MAKAIITLTTDFGTGDSYVAAMKGVVLGLNRDAIVVDVSHGVPPQDVGHGAFVLGSASRYFPPDTIHVAVVDPGVGTARRALLVATPAGRFLAPDNGLVTYVLAGLQKRLPTSPDALGFMEQYAAPVPAGCTAYELSNRELWREPASDTFHGRDIFAPVAAHLSLGSPSEDVGERVEDLVLLNVGPGAGQGRGQEGRVVFIDRFGNLVTNLRPPAHPGSAVRVELRGAVVHGPKRSYAEGEGLRAVVGSHGYLEVAQKNGSAAASLGARVGDPVSVRASKG